MPQIIVMVFWVVMLLINLIIFSFFHVSLVLFCFLLCIINFGCYFKCHGEHQKKAQEITSKIGIQSEKMFWCIFYISYLIYYHSCITLAILIILASVSSFHLFRFALLLLLCGFRILLCRHLPLSTRVCFPGTHSLNRMPKTPQKRTQFLRWKLCSLLHPNIKT